MQRITEVIIIRAADPDGSMFRAIMDALRGRRAEVIELATRTAGWCSKQGRRCA